MTPRWTRARGQWRRCVAPTVCGSCRPARAPRCARAPRASWQRTPSSRRPPRSPRARPRPRPRPSPSAAVPRERARPPRRRPRCPVRSCRCLRRRARRRAHGWCRCLPTRSKTAARTPRTPRATPPRMRTHRLAASLRSARRCWTMCVLSWTSVSRPAGGSSLRSPARRRLPRARRWPRRPRAWPTRARTQQHPHWRPPARSSRRCGCCCWRRTRSTWR